jgi:hypothetical protein
MVLMIETFDVATSSNVVSDSSIAAVAIVAIFSGA